MKISINQKWTNQTYDLTIEKNKSIQIDCFYKNSANPRFTSRLFNIGDKAEYNSYNLSYIGMITGITDKTITFETGTAKQPETRRLKLEEFCWRNWKFNLEATQKYNIEEMQCI